MRESLTPVTCVFPRKLQRLSDDTCWPEKLIMTLWEAINVPLAKATSHLFERTPVERILHVCDHDCGEWGHVSHDLFPHEIKVASSAIQWLGTNNGRYFLTQRVAPLCQMYGVGEDASHMIIEAFLREHRRHVPSVRAEPPQGTRAFVAGSIHECDESCAPARDVHFGRVSDRDMDIYRATIGWLGTDEGSGMFHAFLCGYDKENRNRRVRANPL